MTDLLITDPYSLAARLVALQERVTRLEALVYALQVRIGKEG